MQLVTRLLQSTAQRLGYDLTPHWKQDAMPLARHLRSLFAKYAIDTVFDVGANRGQYHDFLRSDVGFKGLIISFEPVRKYSDFLKERAAKEKHWVIRDFALGNCDKSLPINVTHSPGLNSFLTPIHSELVSHTEVVSVRRLDSVYAELRSNYGIPLLEDGYTGV
jgi:FkbM family methyltransferase